MKAEFEINENLANPLDCVEEILDANNWVFQRMNADELIVEIKGRQCTYRLFFIWQEEMNALQFCCQYDMKLHKDNINAAAKVLMKLNESLWMGHFDIPRETRMPCFRHTCLLRGISHISSLEHIEDLVDISMAQCERFYPAFDLLQYPQPANDEYLKLAMMETVGEA